MVIHTTSMKYNIDEIKKIKSYSQLRKVATNLGLFDNKPMDELKAQIIAKLNTEQRQNKMKNETPKKQTDNNEKKKEEETKAEKEEPKKENTEEEKEAHGNIEDMSKTIKNYFKMFLEKILDNCEEKELNIIRDWTIHNDSDITTENEITIKADSELAKFAIVISNTDTKPELFAVLNIFEEEGKKYLVADKENVLFDKISAASSCKIILFSKESETGFIKLSPDDVKGYYQSVNITVKEMPDDNDSLSIDFGTTNTSLGLMNIGGGKHLRKLVYFRNPLENNEKMTLLPTIVYVKSCKDKKIEYKFGYDALKEIKERNFYFRGSVFYEIKRWLQNINKSVDICGEDGTRATVTRKDILRAYLDFILTAAKNQFKTKFRKLHFTTPVKNKETYLNALSEIFKDTDYEIIPAKQSLDEGVAVIYAKMKDIIEYMAETNQRSFSQDRRIAILDIGGGTTDVVSCNFSIEDDDAGSYDVNINTFPENSDSNFGGNNITFRIFQYLKIKFVKYFVLGEDSVDDIDTLISPTEYEILQTIDKQRSVDEIYKTFNEEYRKASEFLPTNFSNNKKFNSQKELDNIKHNFYLLWEIAENVKKDFFKKTNTMCIDINNDDFKNKIINFSSNNGGLDFALVDENGKLENTTENIELTIGIVEIKKLIYADIYNVLRKVFSDIYEKGITKEYQQIILSGQTCKISLIADLIKEFIAGRDLRSSSSDLTSNKNNDIDKLRLKMNCIKGSIEYRYDVITGGTYPVIKAMPNELKHKVFINRNTEIEILSKDHFAVVQYRDTADKVPLIIYDADGHVLKHETYNISHNTKGVEVDLEELKNRAGNFAEQLQEGVTSARDNRILIMALPCNNGYGFEIMEIFGNNGTFTKLNSQVFSFEVEIDEYNFFKGEE